MDMRTLKWIEERNMYIRNTVEELYRKILEEV